LKIKSRKIPKEKTVWVEVPSPPMATYARATYLNLVFKLWPLMIGVHVGVGRIRVGVFVYFLFFRVEFLLKTESGYLRDAEVT